MNWSGGYKNRFRRQEILCRKNTFQQQSRIPLVDNVSNGKTNQHVFIQKQTGFPPVSTPLDESNKDEKPRLYQSAFSSIPYGSSSDSEELEHSEISDTNYSPYSDSRIEETEDIFPVEKKPESLPYNEPANENEDFDQREIYLDSPHQSPDLMSLDTSSSIECESPPPYQNSEIQCLSFLTPLIHSQKNENLSTTPAKNSLRSDSVLIPPMAYSTPVRDKTQLATPARDETINGKLPIVENKLKTPVNRSLYPHSAVRSDILTSGQRKQVRFAEDHCTEQDLSSPITNNIVENEKSPVIETASEISLVQDQELHNDESDISEIQDSQPGVTTTENASQELPNYYESDISKMQDGITTTESGQKRSFPRKNTPFSFKKFKKFHVPCHCRTIVRKIKIRDAETQTSL